MNVRPSIGADITHVPKIDRLIRDAAKNHDIAVRDVALLEEKVVQGLSALVFDGESLVGFGFISKWKGEVLSHSGVVLDASYRGKGLFREIKAVLLEIGREKFPHFNVVSLSSSPGVQKVNSELGFQPVSLDKLCKDPEFWDGCKGCRRFDEMQDLQLPKQRNPFGVYCCCSAMKLCQ